jgi:hypothetical protein
MEQSLVDNHVNSGVVLRYGTAVPKPLLVLEQPL